MEPKPKQLAYRNVGPDPIIMPKRGNRSHSYAEMWQPIQVSYAGTWQPIQVSYAGTWQPIHSTHHNHNHNHKYILKIIHLSHDFMVTIIHLSHLQQV